MLLKLCTWKEAEAYLQRNPVIIVPIGSTEQHGPNGLIGTDAICPEAIAQTLGDRLDCLVGPTINFGNAQHHLGFVGTISLRPSTLLAVVRDVVESLAQHGFKKIYFLNGHGGNIATVNAAFTEVYARITLDNAPATQCRLYNWFQGQRVKALSEVLYGDDEGSHGTASEVAVTQYVYPDFIKEADFSGRAPASSGIFDAKDYRRRYPDGRIGSDPSRSSPDHGRLLVEAAIEDIAEDFVRFRDAD